MARNLTMNFFALLVFFWIYAEINSRKNARSILERVGKWRYSTYLFHMVAWVFISKLLIRLDLQQFAGYHLITIPIILWLC